MGLSEMTRAASDLFEAGHYQRAAAAYREILDRYPGDRVVTTLLDNTPELASTGTQVIEKLDAHRP
jgi:hypothetical protein